MQTRGHGGCGGLAPVTVGCDPCPGASTIPADPAAGAGCACGAGCTTPHAAAAIADPAAVPCLEATRRPPVHPAVPRRCPHLRRGSAGMEARRSPALTLPRTAGRASRHTRICEGSPITGIIIIICCCCCCWPAPAPAAGRRNARRGRWGRAARLRRRHRLRAG